MSDYMYIYIYIYTIALYSVTSRLRGISDIHEIYEK